MPSDTATIAPSTPSAAPSSAPASSSPAPAAAPSTGKPASSPASGAPAAAKPAGAPSQPSNRSQPAKPAARETPEAMAARAKAAASTTSGAPAAAPANQPAPAAPANDFQQRYDQLARSNSDLGRRFQQSEAAHAQLKQQIAALEKERATAALKPFQAAHPEFHQNERRIAKAEVFQAMVENLPTELNTPQARAALAAKAGVTNDDLQLAHSARQNREAEMARMASDPAGYHAEQIQKAVHEGVQRELSQRDSRESIKTELTQHLGAADVAPFVQAYPQAVERCIADGVPTPYIAQHIRLWTQIQAANAKIKELEGKVQEREATAGMADEQIRRTKAKATIIREPAASGAKKDHLANVRQWCIDNKRRFNLDDPVIQKKLQEAAAAAVADRPI